MAFHKILGWVQNAIHLLIIGCSFYLVIALILSGISIDDTTREKEEGSITIYLITNGVHLDLLLPLRHQAVHWDSILLISEEKTRHTVYVSFGWGDRNFFLETPEWSDLKLSTALYTVFLPGRTAMHVGFYGQSSKGENCIEIRVTPEQYLHLSAYIRSSFATDDSGQVINIPGSGYSDHDMFYEARGSYTFLKTCNTWTNSALRAAGLRSCLWTSFPGPLMKMYR